MRLTRMVPALVALLVVNGAARLGHAVVVCPGGATVPGVDVSWYQGAVDWSQVAASGVTFAYARIANGLTIDSSFAANYAAIRTAGLIRGAYQTLRPGQDAVAQAELALASVGTISPGDLPLALEVSTTDGMPAATVVAAIEAWTAVVQYATGRPPLICTGAYFWDDTIPGEAFEATPLWVCHWTASCPNLPAIWQNWKVWQYSAAGSVPGIAGAVNLNVFNGPLAELRAFAGLASTAVGAAGGPRIQLYPCQPNPFNPRTTIRYDLPVAGPARLAVFDVSGRVIRVLVDGILPHGSHVAVWDGRDAAGRDAGSGAYLARLEFGGRVETVGMGLVR